MAKVDFLLSWMYAVVVPPGQVFYFIFFLFLNQHVQDRPGPLSLANMMNLNIFLGICKKVFDRTHKSQNSNRKFNFKTLIFVFLVEIVLVHSKKKTVEC